MTDHEPKKRIRLFYTDDGRLGEEEIMDNSGPEEREPQSRWLEIFCPQGFCEITSPSQLP